MMSFPRKAGRAKPDPETPPRKNRFLSATAWKETFSRSPSPSRSSRAQSSASGVHQSALQSTASLAITTGHLTVGVQPAAQSVASLPFQIASASGAAAGSLVASLRSAPASVHIVSQSTVSLALPTAPPASALLGLQSASQSAASLALPTAPLPVASVPSPPGSPSAGLALARKITLWEKAIESLPEEDRKTFDFTEPDLLKTLDAILKATEEVKDTCYQKMWKFTWKGKEVVLRDVADKTIAWVNKFKGMGNMISQCDPVHLAIPWAPIKFIMEIAGKDSEKLGSMLVGIEIVTNLIGRCAIYEELYSGSARVRGELVSLYAKILIYLIAARNYYSSSTAVRTAQSLLDGAEYLVQLKDIDEQLQRVCRETDIGEAQTQGGRHEEMMKLLEEFRMPIVRIERNLEVLLDGLEDAKRDKICDWVSDVPFSRYHRTASVDRKPGTCEWLLKSPKFQDWQITSASSILWLHGDPGAGKTKLTSMVVDTVLNNPAIPGNSEALAYFYCKQGEARLSNPEAILRSLVRQLSYKSTGSALHKPTIAAFEAHTTKNVFDDGLGIQECVSLIIKLADLNPQSTIVIDALDECNNDLRHDLFRALKEIATTSTSLVKIFISSRKDDDIELEFKSESNISIDVEDNSADIELYVCTEVARCIAEKKLLRGKVDGALKELVISSLLKSAGGMFLWVELHIRALCKVRLPEEVRDMLNHLPKTLVATFEDIYNRIQSQDGLSPAIAKTVLMWVMCACKPLSPEDLSAMTSLSFGFEVGIDDLLPMCHNLLKVDEALNVVRFFHLSVTEFLEKESCFTLLEANTMAAECCLSLLNNQSEVRCTRGYIILNWPIHLERCVGLNTNHSVWQMLKLFFGSFNKPSIAYNAWLRGFAEHRLKNWSIAYSHPWSRLIDVQTLPPIIAAHFGFFEEVRSLWDERPFQIDLLAASGEPLLHVAIKHENLVRMLLGRGVDVEKAGGRYRHALQAAAQGGDEKVVQILLDNGADVNAQGGEYGNALQAAALRGHEMVLRILLDNGADVNAQGGEYGNALQAAALRGHEMVLRILLDNGADINAQGGWYGSALQAAASGGYEMVLRILLDNGADVNVQGGWYGSALQEAAHEKLVRILGKVGANINVQRGRD